MRKGSFFQTDVIIGGVMVVVFFLLYLSMDLQDLKTWLFPLIIVSLIGIFGIWLVISSVFLTKAEAKTENGKFRLSLSWRHIVSLLIIIFSYFFIITFGFYLSMFFIILILLLIHGGKILRASVVAVITTAVLIVTFVHLIYLPLPLGGGIFRRISIFIMYFTW